MDDTLDLSRWREAPRGVGYRRGVIVAAGIRQLVATRFFKILIYLAWFAGILIAVAGFAFSQSLAEGGWLDTFAQKMGPRAEALFKSLSGLIALYPDIVISGFFTLVFWIHSFIAFYLSTIALSVLVPQLITRDRASNAMIVYLSRPITSFDYLLGKLGTITGVLLMMWTGPLLLGWLLSMVLSSDREFIQYSFTPLLRALSFNGIALLALAPLALGVSALSNSARAATAIWMALWLLVGMLLSVAVQSAMYGLPHVVSVLFSLIGEAVTLGLLWLALVQLFRFLRIGSPPPALFVPILYLLAYVFVISAVLQLVSQAFGLILMLGVAILIFRAAQVICGLKTMPAAGVAGAAFIVLVVVPNALYMLLLFLPSA